MADRIYAVAIKRDIPKGCRLVRASSAAQAIKHVWDHSTYAEVAKQNTIVDLMLAGIRVEDATGGQSSGGGTPQPASANGRPSDFESENSGSSPEAGASAAERDIPASLDRRVPRLAAE